MNKYDYYMIASLVLLGLILASVIWTLHGLSEKKIMNALKTVLFEYEVVIEE